MNQENHLYNNNSQKALQLYSFYRSLQITALIIYFLSENSNYLGQENPILFLFSAGIYGILCLTSVAQTTIPSFPKIKPGEVLAIFITDVLAIVVFIHFSGGVYGSLGILLVVVVATSAVLLRGKLVFLIAALASLSLLIEQIYLYFTLRSNADSFAVTGILGLALFGAALIVQQFANRLRESEEMVSQQADQVEALERFNEQIIERMPSGVIVVDPSLKIKFMNTSAWRLLNQPKETHNRSLGSVSQDLELQAHTWTNNPNTKANTFTVENTHDKYQRNSRLTLSAHFVRLDDKKVPNSGTIIFIENASFLSSQAQKMKLASLGTLTAGIAHEIRNPLGAISHAAQLLGESEELSQADNRLSDIIQQHSIRMNRIIENVLQLSRQKAGNPEDLDLGFWLKYFTKEFKSTQTNPIEFLLFLDDNVSTLKKVDSSQLSQVLTNLCENGLRYSYATSGVYYIRLNCGFDENNRQHYIEVIDKGAGISDSDAEHIFEPFFTTDSKGSGLGLYIAQELCENNQSKLSFNKTIEGNSCFRINFSS